MKNVLVLIHDDPGQERRLQVALDLTRVLGGHLTCLQVTVPPFMVGDDTPLCEVAERERENRLLTERYLAAEGVPFNWIEGIGGLAAEMHDAFGLADIIVISRALETSMPVNMARVAAEVVVDSGKPIVAVPEIGRRFAASEAALIAWNGSIHAWAAVEACVPLLQMTTQVTILEIDDGKLDAPAEEAAAYLSRHGIHARIVRESQGKEDVSDLIVREAQRCNAAYIVMGGFGRSRLAEALLGGVSYDLLKSSPLPLILVHSTPAS